MEFCISAQEIRRALEDLEMAERHGFEHCLGVFRLVQAGYSLSSCLAQYSDLLERAHPTDPKLNWGRFQGVTKRNIFYEGKLVSLKTREKHG